MAAGPDISTALPVLDDDFERLLTGCALAPGLSFLDESFHVAAAVSGGPDSMALAFLLSRLASRRGGRIDALIVDHGLRPESAEEASKTAERLSWFSCVEPFVLTWMHESQATRIQESARKARYDLMAGHCAARGIQALFLAHHQDDQAETILLRLAAGSGLDGLCGMKAAQETPGGLSLIRPFLRISKDRLIATCAHNDILYVSDPSNAAEKFARVRLRGAKEALEREGLTSARLENLARRMQRARRALDDIARDSLEKALRRRDETGMVFDLDILSALPEEISFRVILEAVRFLRPDAGYAPRMDRLEDLHEDFLRHISGVAPFRKRTLGGLVFSIREKGSIFCVFVEWAA